MNEIKIDDYIDGYNIDQISCSNLSMACATGYFNKENYFYYAFLYAINGARFDRNWDILEKNLSVLGLNYSLYAPDNQMELLEMIYKTLADKKPILLEIKYNAIYFNSLYKTDIDTSHLLLITGYDREKCIIVLKDYLMTRDFAKRILKRNVDAFVDFKIPETQLIDMWLKSKRQGLNCFFVLEQGASDISNYKELLSVYIKSANCYQKNILYKTNLKFDSDMKYIRKILYNSVVMLMDVLRRAVESYNIPYDNWKDEIGQILEGRNHITNKIIKLLMKEKNIDNEQVNELLDNDKSIDNLIQEIYINIEKKDLTKKKDAINYALNARVMCDSEKKNARASNAVNGRYESEFDCWLSTYEYKEHWLIVDLGKSCRAGTFIIRHHPKKKTLVTSDYRIEASNDLNNWDVLAEIKDNEKNINFIEIEAVEYRYFRLYIKKANVLDENAARIFSFEIY